jgi:hypothetical protein
MFPASKNSISTSLQLLCETRRISVQVRRLSCAHDCAWRDVNKVLICGFLTGVLKGPSCKTLIFADWDRPKAEETLNAQTFIANNGKYEVMQFDGVLNKVCSHVPCATVSSSGASSGKVLFRSRTMQQLCMLLHSCVLTARNPCQGLVVSDNIDNLVSELPQTSKLPVERISVEAWFSISQNDVTYGGLVAAQQDGTGYVASGAFLDCMTSARVLVRMPGLQSCASDVSDCIMYARDMWHLILDCHDSCLVPNVSPQVPQGVESGIRNEESRAYLPVWDLLGGQ